MKTSSIEQLRDLTELRNRVLSYALKLNQAIDQDTADLASALTTRFCDTLVDYLSAGHFQVFAACVPAAHEYAAIEHTTRAAMAFNDRFGNCGDVDLAEVRAALEQVLLTLETRMQIEDDILVQRQVIQRAGSSTPQFAYA